MNTRTVTLFILSLTLLLISCNTPIQKLIQLPTAVPKTSQPTAEAKIDPILLPLLSTSDHEPIDIIVELFSPLTDEQHKQLIALMTITDETIDGLTLVSGSAESTDIRALAKLSFVRAIKK